MRLKITAAGVGLTLEAPAADDLAAMYAMLLGQPDGLKSLLLALDGDADGDDDDDDDTQPDPDPDGGGGAAADVADRLLSEAGISSD